MPRHIPPVPYKSPVVGRSGVLTRVWADFFRELFDRVGQFNAPSNDELGASVDDLSNRADNINSELLGFEGTQEELNEIQTEAISELQSDAVRLRHDVDLVLLRPYL